MSTLKCLGPPPKTCQRRNVVPLSMFRNGLAAASRHAERLARFQRRGTRHVRLVRARRGRRLPPAGWRTLPLRLLLGRARLRSWWRRMHASDVRLVDRLRVGSCMAGARALVAAAV